VSDERDPNPSADRESETFGALPGNNAAGWSPDDAVVTTGPASEGDLDVESDDGTRHEGAGDDWAADDDAGDDWAADGGAGDGVAPDDGAEDGDQPTDPDEPADDRLHTALPPKLESWRRRSATGAILTGFALGLQQAFEKEHEQPSIIMQTSGDPPRDLPVEAEFEHARPRQSVVSIRPWLLANAAPTEDPESGASDTDTDGDGEPAPGRDSDSEDS